jgi:GTP-binding protein EngB required for normal cell division
LRKKYKDHISNHKNILLIGRTGNGKSTLANVIINKNDNFEEIFRESGGSTSKTREIKEEVFETNKIKCRVIDTPGLGDTSLSRVKTLQEIAKVYDKVKNGLSQILFVSSGRFTPEETETYNLLKEILFDEDITKYTTIIRTKFDNFEDEEECKKDVKSLFAEKNKAITEMLESCNKKIIHVDNPPINIVGNERRTKARIVLNKESRNLSRKKLLKCLEGCDEIYIPESIEILNKIELKEKYKVFGLCQECGRNNTWYR